MVKIDLPRLDLNYGLYFSLKLSESIILISNIINSGDGNGEGIEEIDSMDFGEASVKIEAPDDSEGPIETIDTSPVSYFILKPGYQREMTE